MRQNSSLFWPAGKAVVFIFGFIFSFSLSAAAFESSTPSKIAFHSLRAHARYLASKELAGRGIGTPGIGLARDYIAREFAAYGLQPGGSDGTYLQTFDATTGVEIAEPTRLMNPSLKTLTLDADWIPLGFSDSGTTSGELIFVGYGVTAPEQNYDDYAGIDVQGKVVIVLRYEPAATDPNGGFPGGTHSRHATLRAKALNAHKHGAAAMILVDVASDSGEPHELIPLRRSAGRGIGNFLAAQVTLEAVAQWLEPTGVSLVDLKGQIDRTGRPASVAFSESQIELTITFEEIRERSENVIGILPGTDPKLKQEHVIIGAHYDHLGLGHHGARDRHAEGQVHPGADDNASGTAVLLQLAERIARDPLKPARTIVFAAFAGEELGLYGSRHYVNRPSLELATAKAMINLDMVGRLENNLVTVFGTRSAKPFSAIVAREARKLGLHVRESDNIGRSDHMSFYYRDIPVLHFFTGLHRDYHRHTDTWDKLDYAGMERVTELVLGTARNLAETREPLHFVALPGGHASRENPAFKAFLGTVPAYQNRAEGVKIVAVSPESPAARAGLRPGDVIIRFGGSRIQTVDDLTEQLNVQKPGDEIDILVLRIGARLNIRAKLGARI